MAEAPVLLQDLERGDLPAVCVKTGVPCTTLYRERWWITPQWMLLFLLAGVLPFFVVAAFGSEKVEGYIPLSRDAHRRLRRLAIVRPIAYLVAAFAAGTLFTADALRGAPLLSTVLLCLAAVALVVVASDAPVDVDPGRTRSTVVLRRVHPEFARALGRREGQRLRAGLASSAALG